MTEKTSKQNTAEIRPVVQRRGLRLTMIILFAAALLLTCALTLAPNAKSLAVNAKANLQNEGAEAAIAGIEADFNDGLFVKEGFVEWFGLVQLVTDKRFIRDTDYSYSIVKDNHGNLQFITFAAELDDLVSNIDTYAELGTPIVYVQPPTKFIEGWTEFPATLEDKTTENTNEVIEHLTANNIPTLDLREPASTELDQETMFYATDHHWTTQTAFWAVGKSVDFIREELGIDLDPEGFYTDPDNYLHDTYEDSFLGSQGRRIGRFYGGVDDFTLIHPDFTTDFLVSGLKDNSSREGSFDEAILSAGQLNFDNKIYGIYENHYASYFGGDYSKVVVDNRLNDDGYNVLLLKDSYGLPYAAFLSTMLDSLSIVDLRYYDIASLETLITQSDFDLIIVMYK